MVETKYLKAEASSSPQKIRAVLVLYLLSGIPILVCSWTGCGTSKIYLCLKDSRSSFSWWVENPKLRAHVHEHPFSSARKRYVIWKTKTCIKQLKLNKFLIDVKQLKINKVIFDDKQLKMNRFIKSFSDFIISTSNATLEVPSLSFV